MTDLEELDDKIYADRTKVLKSLAKGADMAIQELEDKLFHNLRITAALEALDKATSGEWATIINYADGPGGHQESAQVVTKIDSLVWLVATMNPKENARSNATLIAAAPDMAAEIVKLRKWQSEAVRWLQAVSEDAAKYLEIYRNSEYRTMVPIIEKNIIDIDRLIAEAKEQEE